MGLLQAAYRTYLTLEEKAGEVIENEKPLAPVGHTIANAQLEITISDTGAFISAAKVPKAERTTIIPVTIESASRSGSKSVPHPLCDNLERLCSYETEKWEAYCEQLGRWVRSPFCHPKVRAVWEYIQADTLLTDLATAGVIELTEQGLPAEGKIEGSDYAKCLVRWRVLPAPENGSSACWQDPSLFKSYWDFYQTILAQRPQSLCLISGRTDTLCEMHPKGVVASYGNAKLISSNDDSGFTYRGRFTAPEQAASVGYTASQGAHSALRWLVQNHSALTVDKRVFLCWNPEGKPVPALDLPATGEDAPADFTSYRKQLVDTLAGYRMALLPEDDVIVAALDAATTGRLAATYYNELSGPDFLDRLENWYATCCWDTRYRRIVSPSLRQIVTCAFGTDRGRFIEADDRLLRERVQQLFHCLVDAQPLPLDIVHALVTRAGMPQAYSPENWERVLSTACAVVRKYRNDRAKKEEWTLALDTSNKDRSYLYGRLLALAEQAERSTYSQGDARATNALRLQTIFAQRPEYAWPIIYSQLTPYLKQLSSGLRFYYQKLFEEVYALMDPCDPDRGKKLSDTYLFGYYHQRNALTRKKETTVTEEKES